MKWGITACLASVLCILPSLVSARDLGVDVSHFQGPGGNSAVPQSNWNQLAAQGDDFAYIKATEGLTGPDDSTMSANVSNARAAGLVAGVYHFAHPENRPTVAGAALEADHFLTFAGSDIGPGFLRPALDIEGSAFNLSSTALTDWVIAFANEIVAQRGSAATPIIYTTSPSSFDNRMSSYDLWIRSVSASNNPQTGNPSTGMFGNWVVWQYNVGSAGGLNPVDEDVLHSEYKSLSAMTIPEPAFPALLLGLMAIRHRRRTNVRLCAVER